MRERSVFLFGIVCGIIIPPGLTSFIILISTWLLSGGSPIVPDPSIIGSNLLFFMIAFLVPEVALTAILFRRQARRQGLALAAFTGINLALGAIAFLSLMSCGLC